MTEARRAGAEGIDGRAVLASPGLHLSLALLALNDGVWKAAYGNAVTGKLSDVAGLFAFALFWTAVLPRRRTAVALVTAAGFALWKSPLAQPLLDAWNAAASPAVGRTVDAGDLAALAVLPLAWAYAARARPAPWCRRPVAWAVVPLALVAFAATVVVANVPLALTYPFAAPRSAVQAAMEGPGLERGSVAYLSPTPTPLPAAPDSAGERVLLRVPSTLCHSGYTADLWVRGDGARTDLHLRRAVSPGCTRMDVRDVRWAFERCVLPRIDAALAAAGHPQPAREDPGEAPRRGPPWRRETLRCLADDGAP
jgi:hypothetical protein